MTLSHTQKDNIGYSWLMDQVRPASPVGRELLRRLQPYSPDDREALEREFQRIETTVENRSGLEKAFSRLEHLFVQTKDLRPTLRRCQSETLGEVELFELKRLLLQLEEIRVLFGQINRQCNYPGLEISDTGETLRLLDPDGTRVASFHVSSRYSEELTAIRREKRELEESLRTLPAGEAREGLLARRREVVAAEEREEERIRAHLSQSLRPWLQPLQMNLDTIAALDLIIQKARLAEQFGGVRPTLTGNTLELVEMVNPAIAHNLEEKDRAFTPLTLYLEPGVTVITGANMGGKSVALKTAALNVLLVHMGFYPVAREARIPLFHSLHLVSEDLEAVDRGLSSFGGEMVRLGEVLRAVEEGFSLILLDEFARGTNPREGAAIAQGVAEYLDGCAAVTLMTTHYDGVADCGSAHYQVVGLRDADFDALSREVREGGDGVARIAQQMDYGLYRVEEEAALPRDALRICRLLGVENRLLEIIEKRIDNSPGSRI